MATLFAGVAFATDYTWQADEKGSYDGLFTDAAHWKGGVVPGAETGSQTAVFPAAADRTSRIYFPDGTFDNYSGFRLYVADGQDTWFIGTNTTWNLATPPSGTSRDMCRVYLNVNNPPSNNNGTAFRGTADGSDVLKNFKIEYSNTPELGTVLDLWEGNFTFSPTWYFFDNNKMADKSGRFEIRFHPESTTKFKNRIFVGAMNATNAFTFLGGTHTFNSLWSQSNVGMPAAGTSNRVDFTFRGGARVSTGDFKLSEAPNSTTFNITLSEGAELSSNSSYNKFQTGIWNIDLSGEGTKWTESSRAYFGTSANSHVKVRVADGATLYLSCNIYVGAETAAALENNELDFLVTNATLTVAKNAFEMRSGSLRVIDSVMPLAAQIDGSKLASATPTCYLNGAYSELTTTATGFLTGFQTVSLGNRGYWFHSKHPVTSYNLSQNFSDAPGEPGELKFTTQYPSCPLTLSSANSTESRFIIGNGTVKLASGANHYTHLTVTGGATFSMKDNASTATLRGLTLGTANETAATFELDPTDTLRVEGPVSFTNGVFKYSSTLPYGTNTVFASAAATEAEIENWLLGIGFSIDGTPDGAFVTYETETAEGVTAFQVIVKESVPVSTGDRNWSASGTTAAWGEAGNWGGAVPSATERAVFGVQAAKTVTIAGAAEAAALCFTEGGYKLSGGTLKLARTSASPAISVAEGTVEIASNLRLTDFIGVRAEVYVAEGATLILSGRILGGGIVKTGKGKLILTNVTHRMSQGVAASGGILSATDPHALGGASPNTVRSLLQSDTLEIAGDATGLMPDVALDISGVAETDAVVLNADVDATLRLGDSTGASIFKRGAGALALQTDADRTLNVESYQSTSVTTSSDVQFAADGTAPDISRGSINVVEGELAFRGPTSATVTLPRAAASGSAMRRIYLPYPTTSELAAEPKFVIDGVKFVAKGHNVQFGSYLSSSATATKPELIITNGAYFEDWTFQPSTGSTKPGLVPCMTVDRGTFATASFLGNGSGDFIVTNRYTFRNGSALYVSSQNECSGPTEMTFDNSVYAKSSALALADDLIIKKEFSGKGRVLSMAFRNGSTFACAQIKGKDNNTIVYATAELLFDDSEWIAGAADKTLPSVAVDVTTMVTGSGLTLAPAEGVTWTWAGPLVGTGDLVKDGEGKVFFTNRIVRKSLTAEPTLRHTGLTDVRAGTLAFSATAISNFTGRAFRVVGTLDFGGALLSNAVITAAGGTVRNATLVAPTFKVEYDDERGAKGITLDYANGLKTTGRVVFDFDGAAPGGQRLPTGTTLTVARWTGTKPDVARPMWRWANLPDKLVALYTANDDGTITARICHDPGFKIIFR